MQQSQSKPINDDPELVEAYAEARLKFLRKIAKKGGENSTKKRRENGIPFVFEDKKKASEAGKKSRRPKVEVSDRKGHD